MKKLLIILLLSLSAFGQQADTLQPRMFAFTPFGKKVDQVNGLALGVGFALTLQDTRPVKVNGFNLELNPLTPLIILFLDPERVGNDTIAATVNGLHISTAGFMHNAKLNGLGISVYNIGMQSNGMSVTGLYNVSKVMNGLHICGIVNSAETKANGLFIAPFNYAGKLGGMQLGGCNRSDYFKGAALGFANISYQEMTGVQIGLFNRAKKCRGLQIGL
ncbi:MAG: hypothetical protein V4581_02085, partial [Bacteroidota bacterium]